MLLAVLAIALGWAAGRRSGGRLSNLAHARVPWIGALAAGTALELAGSFLGSGGFGLALLIAGYLLLFAFAAANVRLTGMVLVAVGLLANLAVFAADGSMPVAGVPGGWSSGSRHRAERPDDHLLGLADVVHVPLVGEVVSAGDILICLGVAAVTWDLMDPTGRPRRLRTGQVRRPETTRRS